MRPADSIVVILALLWAPACAGAQDTPAPAEAVVHGSFTLPEVSGCGFLDDTLLLVADDPVDEDDSEKVFHMIALLPNGTSRLDAAAPIDAAPQEQLYKRLLELAGAPGATPDAETLQDLEDVARSPAGDVFLTTSFSLNKKGNQKPQRERLVRLRFSEKAELVEAEILDDARMVQAIPESLLESRKRNPGAVDPQKRPDPGFNIEALAWAPGGSDDLLMGLRSPLAAGKAIVLRLKDVDAAFDERETPLSLAVEAELDLGGAGIRGMCHDAPRHGTWLIAGQSADPNEPAASGSDWSIWFWGDESGDGKALLNRRWGQADLPTGVELANPEAVCIIEGQGGASARLLLISDNGAATPSSYILIPLSRLGL